MTKHIFDWRPLYEQIRGWGFPDWARELERLCGERVNPTAHGTLPKWTTAWNALPAAESGQLQLGKTEPAVTVHGNVTDTESLVRTLMEFHPWRKGPFELFGIPIDTEWRSDWKWQRLRSRVDVRAKKILDVGSGNGYYGWQMLREGAEFVLGCDPFLLYVAQCEVFRRYAQSPERHFVVPLTDEELPDDLRLFDITFSMGVLYHRTSPIEHLQKLHGTLRPQGQLILETLIIEAPEAQVLVPRDRYAKMRNVWFLPSPAMLEIWLARTGFTDIQVLDVTRTSTQEQRRTRWMTFESLEDFLDPGDPNHTLEGYPAPVRAMLSARKKN